MGPKAIEIELNMTQKEENICLKKSAENTYLACDNSIEIIIEQDKETGGRKISFMHCEKRLERYRDAILGLFEARYDEAVKNQQENYESGFESVEEEEQFEIKVPYNPQSITVAPAKFSLKEIVGMIDGEDDEEAVLDLAPDFQRDYVWDSVRKSRLIESILLNIPLPVFYFARDKEGRMQVVDGVQRLTTIYNFFKNKFKLSKLEYLGEECEGQYFKKDGVSEDKNLRPKLVRALKQYQIDCNVIEPSTPENVKLDIFKRLNTGGKDLNKQEVRHAFMKKEVREFVKKMVELEEFLRATDYSINDNRMMAQELVLRYIGFYCLYIDNFLHIEYATKMDEFIDNIAVQMNMCKEIPYNEIAACFKKSMQNAYNMFGEKAFRKIELDEEDNVLNKKNPINKSLFIAFSVLLSSYDTAKVREAGNKSLEFAKYLICDNEFYYSISHNTNYQLRETAIGKVKQFLDAMYGE